MSYVYNVSTGIARAKMNAKKYIFGGLAAVTVLATGTGAAFAASPVVSEQAGSNACFGQARASYAKGGPNSALLPAGTTNGTYISERKGNNPAVNAQYIEDYCN